MAQIVAFGNRITVEPGVYARTVSGVAQNIVVAASGKVMIIDTGTGVGFGGGAGIDGELTRGGKAIYELSDVSAAREFLGGGIFWDLTDLLFNPYPQTNALGAQSLLCVRAARTRAAAIPLVFTGGGASGARASVSLRVRSASVAIGTGGAGYTNGPFTVTLVGGTFTTAATFNVVVTAGAVASITLANPGVYSVAPATFAVTGLPVVGSGFTFTADFELGTAVINAGGIGYTVAPDVRIIGGDAPTPAVGTATILAGAVSAITFSNQGQGYRVAPAIALVSTNANGGFLVVKVRDEGTVGNGVLIGTRLTRGYAARIVAGRVNPNALVLQIWRGQFRGINENGEPFDFTAEVDTEPALVIQSPEFTNYATLVEWMQNDGTFIGRFALTEQTQFGTGAVTTGDLATGYIVAQSGLELYRVQDMDNVLEYAGVEDNTYFLADRFGAEGQAAQNVKILGHILTESDYDKFLFIGGGYGEGQLDSPTGSIPTAVFYNNDRVHIVHSACILSMSGGRQRQYSSLYHAAIQLGRIAGLPPQVPGTYKALRIVGLAHEASKPQRERMLQAGVMHAKFEDNEWVINSAINTLQRNTQILNPDGTSYLHQVKRIAAQLNKELIINARTRRDSDGNRAFIGSNRNRASAAEVKSFAEGFLQSRTATPSIDNLIVSFNSVTVERSGSKWFVRYAFQGNTEIDGLYFTGVQLDLGN